MNQHSKNNILVLGAAVIDKIIRIKELPLTGQDITGTLEDIMVGGCAYNVQQIIEAFSLKHCLAVPVGNGPNADLIRKKLNEKKIPVTIEEIDQDNGWNISFVEEDGERTFLTVPGIEADWREEWFRQFDLSAYDYIYLSGYELEGPSGEVIVKSLVKQKHESTKLIFDPSPRATFIAPSVLEAVWGAGTIVHCNKSELLSLFPGQSLEQAAAMLQNKTGEAVVITLGKDGCYYKDGTGSGYVEGRKVTVVDTIGAGDSHTGGFISGLAMGMTLEDACRLGNEVSAKVVSQPGGSISKNLIEHLI